MAQCYSFSEAVRASWCRTPTVKVTLIPCPPNNTLSVLLWESRPVLSCIMLKYSFGDQITCVHISLTSGNNLPAKDASHSVCIHCCFFHSNSVSLNPHSSFLLFGEDSSAVSWNEHRLLVLFIRPSVPSGLLSLQEAVGTTYIFQSAESCLCVRQKLPGDSEILPSVILPLRAALLPSSGHI